MRWMVIVTLIAGGLGSSTLVMPAQAAGCLKGAVIGGVAGHYAGHHGHGVPVARRSLQLQLEHEGLCHRLLLADRRGPG